MNYKAGDKIPYEDAKALGWRSFGEAENCQVGQTELRCVAICKTQHIVCDPVDYYVMLECKVVMSQGAPRWAVICPRYPQGIHPGVWVGVPMISPESMQPMPRRKRMPIFRFDERSYERA